MTTPLFRIGALLFVLGCATACTTSRSAVDSSGPECSGPESRDRYDAADFSASLVAGNEDAITLFACQYLQARAALNTSILSDLRRVPLGTIVRIPAPEHYYQFRPATVADAAACLMSVKYRRPTNEILESYPELANLCTHGCDVCSSQVVDLDARVRAEVLKYWSGQLKR